MSRRRLGWIVALGAVAATIAALALELAHRKGTSLRAPAPASAPSDEPDPQAPVEQRTMPQPPVADGAPEAMEAEAPQPLPSCFFGQIKIEGIVRDERGSPMAGLRVECVPCTIDPATADRLARFTCASDERGAFLLESLPEASRYAFKASGAGAYGEATHLLEDIRGTMVVIVVSSTISYERYDFFDQNGVPIDVRGRLAFGSGDLIWASGHGATPETTARLAAIGLPVGDLPANASMAVFHRPGATRQLGLAGETVVRHVVRIAGYSETSIDPVRCRPNEWPRSSRVTLQADGSPLSIAHRLRLPAAPSPLPSDIRGYVEAVWDRMCIRVQIEDASVEGLLSRFRPFFWAPRDAKLRFRLESSDIPLRHHVTYDDDIAAVTLEMPDLSVPYVRYDPRTAPWAGVGDQERVHFQMEQQRGLVRGRMSQPGLVFFGPVIPGDVTLRCVWPEAGGFSSRVKGPLTLSAGLHEIRWE